MAKDRQLTEDEQRQVDEDWPEQPESTTDVAVPRSVTMNLPAGSAVQMDVQQLKMLTFDQISNMEVVDATEELGVDQFGPILEDKGKLCGVPLVILHWETNPKGEFGSFTTLYVLTQSGDRFIVNDGSTGIHTQLVTMKERSGIDSMLVCKRGFKLSEYDKDLPNGKTTRAKTFYIDTQVKA